MTLVSKVFLPLRTRRDPCLGRCPRRNASQTREPRGVKGGGRGKAMRAGEATWGEVGRRGKGDGQAGTDEGEANWRAEEGKGNNSGRG